jgi:hypothetical protein
VVADSDVVFAAYEDAVEYFPDAGNALGKTDDLSPRGTVIHPAAHFNHTRCL